MNPRTIAYRALPPKVRQQMLKQAERASRAAGESPAALFDTMYANWKNQEPER